jgi:hypothetical protein
MFTRIALHLEGGYLRARYKLFGSSGENSTCCLHQIGSHTHTHGVFEKQIAYTHYNFSPLSCQQMLNSMKQAYALCAGPLIHSKAHVVTATVFDLCDKQS